MARFINILAFSFICVFNTLLAQDLLLYKNAPIKTAKQWKTKRLSILDSMQAVMGKLPHKEKNTPIVEVLDSLYEKRFTRFLVKLTVAQNEAVFAYLYIPNNKKVKRFPAILALHETDMHGKKSVDGQGKNKNLAYARELAERGYVVIAPDYPSMGDSQDYNFNNDRYQSGTMKAIFNHMRCIDYLISMKEVDPKRIGVIGHSLGGHNALFVSAFDNRLKVAVSSCGWTMFDYYNIGPSGSMKYGGRLGPWAQARYMPLLETKYNLKRVPFDFNEVIAAIAPRAVFSSSPSNDTNFDYKGVEKGIADAALVYHFLGVKDQLLVRYPVSNHDFPNQVRFEAYRLIDQVLKNTVSNSNIGLE